MSQVKVADKQPLFRSGIFSNEVLIIDEHFAEQDFQG